MIFFFVRSFVRSVILVGIVSRRMPKACLSRYGDLYIIILIPNNFDNSSCRRIHLQVFTTKKNQIFVALSSDIPALHQTMNARPLTCTHTHSSHTSDEEKYQIPTDQMNKKDKKGNYWRTPNDRRTNKNKNENNKNLSARVCANNVNLM